jgi:hypothetical protein
MSITDIPSDEDITEMVQGLPSWNPPKFELPFNEPDPAEAPVQWHEPVRSEVTVPVQSVTLPAIPDGWGATFELPA